MTEAFLIFDYNRLDEETRHLVQQRTGGIRRIVKRVGQDIILIGKMLIDVKAALPHGQFGTWLTCELQWTHMTATRFINVAQKFQNSQIVNFAPSALYLLAAPKTSASAREEAIQRAEAGEVITHATAKTIVAEHKNSPSKTTLTRKRQPTALDHTGERLD